MKSGRNVEGWIVLVLGNFTQRDGTAHARECTRMKVGRRLCTTALHGFARSVLHLPLKAPPSYACEGCRPRSKNLFMQTQLKTFHVMPLLRGHETELADDAELLLDTGVCTDVACIMTLVPEGHPPVDKARLLGERFTAFRDAFKGDPARVGILAQATIGHGWTPDEPAAFQKITRTRTYQQASGAAYRAVLAKYHGFHEALFQAVQASAPAGYAAAVLPSVPTFNPPPDRFGACAARIATRLAAHPSADSGAPVTFTQAAASSRDL